MTNNFKHSYIKINYKNILDAYSHGIFPMAESIDSLDVFWVKPKKRGVIEAERDAKKAQGYASIIIIVRSYKAKYIVN